MTSFPSYFLNLVGAAMAIGGMPRVLMARQTASPPPNIVHIMVDDMSAEAMGFKGKYPFLHTPNLDRLAREGVVFNNFFATTSLCSPSRASILTSRFAHNTGVPDNGGHDPKPELPTYPQLLQEHGYVTAHIGKWHMGEGDEPRPGFSHWFGFAGQGQYFDPVINCDGVRRVHRGYITDILTDDAIAFIRAHAGVPFAINLWHKAMHQPFDPPPRHKVPPHDEFPKPATWDDDLSDKNAGMRRARLFGVHAKQWEDSEGKPVPSRVSPKNFDAKATEMYRRHLSTLQAVDESLGRILSVLKELGILDRTIVIFTADNGFFLGEFELTDKRLAYDPSMRVPMILRYPPVGEGKQLDALAMNLDFAPTFLDWANIPIPAEMEGASLRPLLEGKVEKVHDAIFYEYFQEPYAPGVPTILGIRTERWKYIHYPYESRAWYHDELYDLNSDPEETRNLAGSPSAAKQLSSLKASMADYISRTGYKPPAYRYEPPKAESANR